MEKESLTITNGGERNRRKAGTSITGDIGLPIAARKPSKPLSAEEMAKREAKVGKI